MQHGWHGKGRTDLSDETEFTIDLLIDSELDDPYSQEDFVGIVLTLEDLKEGGVELGIHTRGLNKNSILAVLEAAFEEVQEVLDDDDSDD